MPHANHWLADPQKEAYQGGLIAPRKMDFLQSIFILCITFQKIYAVLTNYFQY